MATGQPTTRGQGRSATQNKWVRPLIPLGISVVVAVVLLYVGGFIAAAQGATDDAALPLARWVGVIVAAAVILYAIYVGLIDKPIWQFGTREVVYAAIGAALYGVTPQAWAGGALYFTTRDGHLWSSDGTAAGTADLGSAYSFPQGSAPRDGVNLGGSLLFRTGIYGNGALWSSDGTEPGTLSLSSDQPAGMQRVGSQLLFWQRYHFSDSQESFTLYRIGLCQQRLGNFGDAEVGVVVHSFDLAEIERYRAEWGFFRDRRTDLYAKSIT